MKYLKLFEDMSFAKSIIAKKMDSFEKLKTLLSKNMGYIGKFTDYLFNENIPYSDLVNLYNELLFIKSKNRSININDLSYEKLLDKIESEKNDILVQSVVSQFPSEQKKLLGDVKSDASRYLLLLNLAKADDITAFISKISRHKDINSLTNAMKLFGKKALRTREEVIDYVGKSKDSEVVFSNDNILIVRVGVIADIKVLGSDTSWCILGESMWKQYMNGPSKRQFILYNYNRDEYVDPKFKIGFTLDGDRISAAHDILDKSATDELKKVISENGVELSSLYKEKVVNIDDIFNINGRTKIDILKEMANKLSINSLGNFISKLLDVSRVKMADEKIRGVDGLSDAKVNVIEKALNRYFISSDYILLEDLDKLDPRLRYIVELTRINKVIRPNYINIFASSSDAYVAKSFELCTDQGISKGLHVSAKILYDSKDDRPNFSKKTMELMLNRIDTIRKSNEGYDKKIDMWYATLCYLLGKPELVDKSTLSSINSFVLQNPDIFKKAYDINNLPFNAGTKDVVKIEKKDMEDDKYIVIGAFNQMFIKTLLEHMKGYKLNFKISKATLKELLNKKSIPELVDVLSKFPKTLRIGSRVSDGKISVSII